MLKSYLSETNIKVDRAMWLEHLTALKVVNSTDLDHQLENSRLMQQQMTVDSNSHHPIAARLGTPLHKLNYNNAIVGMNYIFLWILFMCKLQRSFTN